MLRTPFVVLTTHHLDMTGAGCPWSGLGFVDSSHCFSVFLSTLPFSFPPCNKINFTQFDAFHVRKPNHHSVLLG